MKWEPIETAPKNWERVDLWILYPRMNGQKTGERKTNCYWHIGMEEWLRAGNPIMPKLMEGEDPKWLPVITHWLKVESPDV